MQFTAQLEKHPSRRFTEADNLAAQMEAQWKEIKSALWQSKSRMVAGEEGELLSFEIGEEAWLDAKNLKL
ncbi:hypothetical protein RhiTH_011382 [Rhizoctonia solani]